MDPTHNSAEQLSALQQPALLPIAVPPTQNRNLASRCSHPFVGTIPELLPIHSAPTPAPPDPKPPVFEFLRWMLIMLISWMLAMLIDFSITAAYGQNPATCFLFVGVFFVVAIIILVIQFAAALQQENQTRRRDQTHSRTGYIPPNARQRTQERQRVPPSEEEAGKEICHQEEEDETDEEFAQNVKGHLTQMFEASKLASAEGISFSEALQRVSNNEQEMQEDNKSGGTSDA
jgi:hypothetical protein